MPSPCQWAASSTAADSAVRASRPKEPEGGRSFDKLTAPGRAQDHATGGASPAASDRRFATRQGNYRHCCPNRREASVRQSPGHPSPYATSSRAHRLFATRRDQRSSERSACSTATLATTPNESGTGSGSSKRSRTSVRVSTLTSTSCTETLTLYVETDPRRGGIVFTNTDGSAITALVAIPQSCIVGAACCETLGCAISGTCVRVCTRSQPVRPCVPQRTAAFVHD